MKNQMPQICGIFCMEENMPESKICPNPRSLILPAGQKNNWEDCARRLAALPDDVLRPLLPELMEWFQDLNWPGAEAITRRLEALPAQELRAAIAGAREIAAARRDDEWLENLAEFETLGSRIWDPA